MIATQIINSLNSLFIHNTAGIAPAFVHGFCERSAQQDGDRTTIQPVCTDIETKYITPESETCLLYHYLESQTNNYDFEYRNALKVVNSLRITSVFAFFTTRFTKNAYVQLAEALIRINGSTLAEDNEEPTMILQDDIWQCDSMQVYTKEWQGVSMPYDGTSTLFTVQQNYTVTTDIQCVDKIDICSILQPC